MAVEYFLYCLHLEIGLFYQKLRTPFENIVKLCVNKMMKMDELVEFTLESIKMLK